MIGWELPPHNSGGLGVACLSLAKALVKKGAEITFVLPQKVDLNPGFMKVVFANVKESFQQLHNAYLSYSLSSRILGVEDVPSDYVEASLEYASQIGSIIDKMSFDVIHAHDWLCIPAAMVAKEATGKPLVLHIHATEIDRAGGNFSNSAVFEIEKRGMQYADKVVAVSQFTKNIIVNNYGIPASKIFVVHNGVEVSNNSELEPVLTQMKESGYKIVLFLGRITLQKGPEYFVRAARRVLDYDKKVIFVVVGSGDMQEAMMDEVYHLGLSRSFIFTGFLRGLEGERIFRSADVYVMPSVSEPFGITSLEAVAYRVPVITSKQSGVSEVLHNALKVDFWDVDEIANKILSVVGNDALRDNLISESYKELPEFSWNVSAEKCVDVYQKFAHY